MELGWKLRQKDGEYWGNESVNWSKDSSECSWDCGNNEKCDNGTDREGVGI